MNSRKKKVQIISAAAILAAFAMCGLAQTSELYLTSWDTTGTYVVQNGAIVRQFNRSGTSDGPGLVVHGTIKCIG